MSPLNAAPRPLSTTRMPLRLFPVAVLPLLVLVGCATPVGGVASTATPSTAASVSPEPAPRESPSATVAPSPTVTPFTGDVLVVTAEVLDGQLQVTAMVPTVSEGNGTCVLELVGTDRTVSVTGAEGNDVTYCGVMSMPVEGAASDVQFRVRYESPSTRAESAVTTAEPAP